jgi:hypothetical protein
MKKIHIVSAQFGSSYQRKEEITLPPQNGEFEITTSFYNDRNTNNSRKLSLHPRTKGKIPKMLEWMNVDADYYIWMDHHFNIISEDFLSKMMEYIGDFDICVHNHSQRTKIKDECEFVYHYLQENHQNFTQKYDGELMHEQTNYYLRDTNFIDEKLFEMGFFIYSKKLVMNRNYNLLTDWFLHNCMWSIEDQISFPYMLYQHKTNYTTFPFGVLNNPYAQYDYK